MYIKLTQGAKEYAREALEKGFALNV